ncbi:nucleotidyltransferase family protein [bacterium]|nr:nucleotidyltransferase family protein [bacterium]
MSTNQYPVFVMCGRDVTRRKLMEAVDPENQYKSKALLPFLGKRLIEWQLDELRQSPYVQDIYLLGLTEKDITLDYPVHFVPVESTADVSVKFGAGVDYLSQLGPLPNLVAISSCDAPGIRIDEINQFFKAVSDSDGAEFVMSLVPVALVEAAFPGSGRVTAHFRDGDVFPGEIYALSPRLIRLQQEAIREMNQRRRKINRTRRKVGMGPIVRYLARRPQTWSLLLRYGLGMATLADAERAVGAALGGRVRGVVIPEVGFGMDMDLPEDYQRLEDYVRRTKLS